MDNEFAADLITLVDEEGNEHEFEILDVIDNDEGCFYALIPKYASKEQSLDAEATYYIFEAIEEGEEVELAEVEDEDLLDRLADIFESRFEALYDEENPNS